MITFLTSPKPFFGRDSENQLRAIRSWKGVGGEASVILFGNSVGIEAAAAQTGAIVCTNVRGDEHGLPYFGSIVERAEALSSAPIFCYLNSDIVLPRAPDFSGETWARRNWVAVGRRIDLGEGEVLNPDAGGWLEGLRELTAEGRATLHPPKGSDFFVFPRGMWHSLPPLVIGRAGYDNALLAYAIRSGYQTVDVTEMMPALHQFHDYGHMSGGKQEVWQGDQARKIMQTFSIQHDPPTLEDVDARVTGLELRSPKRVFWRLRRASLRLRFCFGMNAVGLACELLRRVLSWSGRCHEDPQTLEGLLHVWQGRRGGAEGPE